MKTKENEFEKLILSWWFWVIVVVVVSYFIFALISIQGDKNSYGVNTSNFDKEENIEDKGLYNIFEVGDLSFQLTEVELHRNLEMWFKYTINNNGGKIMIVNDCGILLFEDGSQYEVQIEYPEGKMKESCTLYEMVPGAKIGLWYGFGFSSEEGYSIPNSRFWEDVPGSKITFFSQQNSGLVKYTIDKSEIIKN